MGWQEPVKKGQGTLILSADNIYTGTTTIEAGTLRVGNGGTTGSLTSTITNNATLEFNRSDVSTHSNDISGTGKLVMAGSGEIILNGNNTYTGETYVNSGTLTAGKENIFASSSKMAVANGATLDATGSNQILNQLTGAGTVNYSGNTLTTNNDNDSTFSGLISGTGGFLKTGNAILELTNVNNALANVAVNGGELKLNHSGVLNVTGDYTTATNATTHLAGKTSQLAVAGEFKQAAGSTLNIMLGKAPNIVADTATLDGILKLGGFAADDETPSKASELIDKQFTLISTTNGITGQFSQTPFNSGGLDYIFYDGAVSADGKDYDIGLKLAWTQADPDRSTGNFTLAENTDFDVDVALDDQTGISFATGWDGKSLTKNGEGLLILSVDNGYTGGTIINEGVLQVASNSNLGDPSGNLSFNGGHLRVTSSFTSDRLVDFASGIGGFDVTDNNMLTLTNNLTGSGGMEKIGSGDLLLAGKSTYSGNTLVKSGKLITAAENVLSSNSAFTVSANSSLDLQGFSQTIKGLDNAGSVHIGSDNGSRIGSTLTVSDTYVSNGGSLYLNTILGDDNSMTDKLIANAVTLNNQKRSTPATRIYINNVGGLGAKTMGNGIEVVLVNDKNNSAKNAFILGKRIAAAAFDYSLYQGGVRSDVEDGNWYLRNGNNSDGSYDVGGGGNSGGDYRPEVVVSTSAPSALANIGIAMLDYASSFPTPASLCDEPAYAESHDYCRNPKAIKSQGLWMRAIGIHGKNNFRGGSPTRKLEKFEKYGPSSTYDMTGAIVGMDFVNNENDDGSENKLRLYAGTMRYESKIKGINTRKAGELNMNAYSIGAQIRRTLNSGLYGEATIQGTYFDSIKSSSIEGQKSKTHGNGLAMGIGTGYPIDLGNNWTTEPQAQFIYQRNNISRLSDDYGVTKFRTQNQNYLRVGNKIEKAIPIANGAKIYVAGKVNLWHGFGRDNQLTVTTLEGTYPTKISTDPRSTWVQTGVSVSGSLTKNTTVFVSGDYNFQRAANRGYSYGGQVGIKYTW